MKCLLVDDEPGIREGMAMLLRRRGCEVSTAASCEQARRMLADEHFDVVVTDWRLPDGEAADYVVDCGSPVIAVSGHPEEVGAFPAIRQVLRKPVSPTVLHEAIVACCADDAAAEPAEHVELALPRAVREVVDEVFAQLPAGVEHRCYEDGAHVVVRIALPAGPLPKVAHSGGDLRVVGSGERERELELRLCKDGRPDAEIPIVPIDGPWPERGRFAIDCGPLDVPPECHQRWLDRVANRSSSDRRVVLLNVPDRLEQATAVWERTHGMPMRERVGPQLTADLAELWS